MRYLSSSAAKIDCLYFTAATQIFKKKIIIVIACYAYSLMAVARFRKVVSAQD